MNYKHGGYYTRLYKIWGGMRDRCNRPKHTAYKWYGGRGIKVCEEWNNFIVFRIWAIFHGYHDHLTIDRIDNDGNYEPNNCQWVLLAENTRKGKPIILIHPDGLEEQFDCTSDACRKYNLNHGNLSKVAQGKQHNKTCKGFKCRYLD